METGFVKFFDETRGFGFITNDKTKTDIFFHFTGSLDKVVASDTVSYEVEEGKRGLFAKNIKRIK